MCVSRSATYHIKLAAALVCIFLSYVSARRHIAMPTCDIQNSPPPLTTHARTDQPCYAYQISRLYSKSCIRFTLVVIVTIEFYFSVTNTQLPNEYVTVVVVIEKLSASGRHSSDKVQSEDNDIHEGGDRFLDLPVCVGERNA